MNREEQFRRHLSRLIDRYSRRGDEELLLEMEEALQEYAQELRKERCDGEPCS